MLDRRLYKILIVFLCINIIVVFTGCSTYMDDYVLRHVTEYANSAVKAMNKDFYLASEKYGKNAIAVPEYDDDYERLFNKTYDKMKIRIDSISVNSSRSAAECKVILDYIAFDLIADSSPSNTKDFYLNAINSAKISSTIIKLTISIEGKNYIFDDLSLIDEYLTEGFDAIQLLDENGMPINLDYEFLLSSYQGSCWYDSFRSNPMTDLCTDYIGGDSGAYMENPQTLRSAFYFNDPLTADVTVELYRDDNLISSYATTLSQDVVLIADFSQYDVGDRAFTTGRYHISISYSDYVLISSETIEVI